MVRDAIARQGGSPAAPVIASTEGLRTHASHAKLTLVSGGDSEGQCIIEPSVRCNHCGYCLSLGH
jgi:hypothetical protein